MCRLCPRKKPERALIPSANERSWVEMTSLRAIHSLTARSSCEEMGMRFVGTVAMGYPLSSIAVSVPCTTSAGTTQVNGSLGSSLISPLRSFSCRVQVSFVRSQKSIVRAASSNGSGASGLKNSGRHAIVTGANSGIGKATALELAKKGMVVTLACRNEESGKAAAREIALATNNLSVRSMAVDLASLESVRQFVADYKDMGLPLHVLVNNAGIMACPQAYTEDNFERQLGVNHLGHFLLTSLLLDSLVASASAEQKSRVVVLSSAAERIGEIDFQDLNYKGSRAYNNWRAYGQSKLANCLFSYELAKRSRKLGLPIISNSMHPGIVNTMPCNAAAYIKLLCCLRGRALGHDSGELIRYIFPSIMGVGTSPPIIANLWGFFSGIFGLKTPEQGASTAVYLASSQDVEKSTGLYYEDSKESTPSINATNPRLASRLWDVSVDLTDASSVLEPLGLAKKSSTVV